MEHFWNPETLEYCLTHYGSIAIFGLLVLGIVALPVPEETLMVFAGALMSNGKLSIHSTMFAAYAGSLCGITVSYLLGRSLGIYILHKYGRWFGITQAKIDKAHDWFEHFGKWTLVIGYFIPGVRHFTGFIAGTSFLEFNTFALFAYAGGLLWVSTFLAIGYFFGNYWSEIFERIELSADWFIMLAVIVLTAFIIYKVKKNSKTKS